MAVSMPTLHSSLRAAAGGVGVTGVRSHLPGELPQWVPFPLTVNSKPSLSPAPTDLSNAPLLALLPAHPRQPCPPPAFLTNARLTPNTSGPPHGLFFCSLCQDHSSPGLWLAPLGALLRGPLTIASISHPHSAPAPDPLQCSPASLLSVTPIST